MSILIKKEITFSLIISIFILLTESFGQSKKDGSVSVIEGGIIYETPKIFELMNIAFALTDTNKMYFNNVDTSTYYYKEIIAQFSKFKNHKLITNINKGTKKNILKYIYNLEKGSNILLANNRLVQAKRFPIVRKWWINSNSEHLKLIADFYHLSGFDQFYLNHQDYYTKTLQQAKDYLNVVNVQQWLEDEFPNKYDQFNIVISPLMRGLHFTQHFTHRNKKTSIMYVSAPDGHISNRLSKDQIAGIYTGIVFTEIDHNYVNPVSNNFKRELNEVMGEKNRNNWIKENGDGDQYDTGYKVFNEYMTHAIYLVYTNLKFPKDDQNIIKQHRVRLMSGRRKYYRFEDFYDQLQKLYISKSQNENMMDLYPKIIDWCKKQNLQPTK